MPEFMMIMKSRGEGGTAAGWEQYIEHLSQSGMFRGGSALGNGICVNRDSTAPKCAVSGYMRFKSGNL